MRVRYGGFWFSGCFWRWDQIDHTSPPPPVPTTPSFPRELDVAWVGCVSHETGEGSPR